MTRPESSVFDGLIEADPIVVGLLVAAVAVLAVAFVVMRVRGRGQRP
jgi:hypothetical protein